MTVKELAVIARGMAPMLREFALRITALEQKEKGLDGKDGARGPDGSIGPPGPPGRDGRDGVPGVPGEKGLNGTNGTDGLGFDDLSVLHDGEGGITFRFQQGSMVKDFTVTIPILIYRGVFTEGKTYRAGDVVTYGGHAWHCRKETSVKPDYVGQGPQPKDFWTLMVKHGRDGKDGRDGVDRNPVVRTR